MSQIAQDIFRDPIWQGIGAIATVLAMLFAIYSVQRQLHPESPGTRIVRSTFIAVLIFSLILFFPFTDRVVARLIFVRGASLRNSEATIELYSRAIALDPDFSTAYNNRGLAYYDKGDYDRAIADYDQAIQLEPDATTYYSRGLAYYYKGDYDRAIADYDQAIKLKPDYAIAYRSRGRAYRKKGDYDRAIADLNQAIALAPQRASFYYSRGFIHHAFEQYGFAIADFTESIVYDSEGQVGASNYCMRGDSYKQMSDIEKAIADFETCLQLDQEGAWTDFATSRLAELHRSE